MTSPSSNVRLKVKTHCSPGTSSRVVEICSSRSKTLSTSFVWKTEWSIDAETIWPASTTNEVVDGGVGDLVAVVLVDDRHAALDLEAQDDLPVVETQVLEHLEVRAVAVAVERRSGCGASEARRQQA